MADFCYICREESDHICTDCGKPVCDNHYSLCHTCGRSVCKRCARYIDNNVFCSQHPEPVSKRPLRN